MSTDYVPSFRRAARRKAEELGITEDELRTRIEARRRAADAYPRPDCLQPEEFEMLAGEAVPEDRLRHVETCPTCAALIEVSTPRPGGLEALLDEVRRHTPPVPARPRAHDAVHEPGPVAALAGSLASLLAHRRLVAAAFVLVALIGVVFGPRSTVRRQLPLDELTTNVGRHGFGTAEQILPRGDTVVLASYETSSSPAPSFASATYLVRAKCRPFGLSWLHWGRARFDLLKEGRSYVSSTPIYGGCDRLSERALAFVAAASKFPGDVAPRQITANDLAALDPAEIRSAILYLEGIDALSRFEPTGALRLLQQATKSDPRNPFTHMALSEAWGALGYEDQAIREAQLAARLAESDPELSQVQRQLIAARSFAAAADWERAIEIYGSLRARLPDDETYALKLAEAQIGAGEAHQAILTLERLRTSHPNTQHDPRAGLLEATAAGRLPDYARKRDAAMRAAADAMAAGNLLLAGQAQLLEAQARYQLEDKKDRTLDLYRKAEETFVKAGYSTGVADIRMEQARILSEQAGESEHARELILQALGTYQSVGNRRRAALAHVYVGHTEADAGRRAQARKHYMEALTTFNQLNDRPRRAQVLTSIGLLDREDGRLDSALSNLNAALDLCNETQNKSCRASALSNLASVYEARLELDHAFSLLREALDLRLEIQERSGEARIRRAMGEVLLQKGQLADAQARFTEALTIEKQLVEPVEVGVTLLAMARLENARGAPGRALALATQAEEKFRRADRKLELVQTYNLRADAYLSSGQPFLALESNDRASDLLADISVSDTSTLDVRDTYLSTLIAEARIEAATGNATSARAALADEIAAWKGPSSMMQLEALLQLGLLETSSGIPGGEERIARVRAEAESRHLGLLEKKAEASPR